MEKEKKQQQKKRYIPLVRGTGPNNSSSSSAPPSSSSLPHYPYIYIYILPSTIIKVITRRKKTTSCVYIVDRGYYI